MLKKLNFRRLTRLYVGGVSWLLYTWSDGLRTFSARGGQVCLVKVCWQCLLPSLRVFAPVPIVCQAWSNRMHLDDGQMRAADVDLQACDFFSQTGYAVCKVATFLTDGDTVRRRLVAVLVPHFFTPTFAMENYRGWAFDALKPSVASFWLVCNLCHTFCVQFFTKVLLSKSFNYNFIIIASCVEYWLVSLSEARACEGWCQERYLQHVAQVKSFAVKSVFVICQVEAEVAATARLLPFCLDHRTFHSKRAATIN